MKCRWCDGTGRWGEYPCEVCGGLGMTTDPPFYSGKRTPVLSNDAVKYFATLFFDREREMELGEWFDMVAVNTTGQHLPDQDRIEITGYWMADRRDETLGEVINRVAIRAVDNLFKSP